LLIVNSYWLIVICYLCRSEASSMHGQSPALIVIFNARKSYGHFEVSVPARAGFPRKNGAGYFAQSRLRRGCRFAPHSFVSVIQSFFCFSHSVFLLFQSFSLSPVSVFQSFSCFSLSVFLLFQSFSLSPVSVIQSFSCFSLSVFQSFSCFSLSVFLLFQSFSLSPVSVFLLFQSFSCFSLSVFLLFQSFSLSPVSVFQFFKRFSLSVFQFHFFVPKRIISFAPTLEARVFIKFHKCETHRMYKSSKRCHKNIKPMPNQNDQKEK